MVLKESTVVVKCQLYECAIERRCHASLSMVLNDQNKLVEPLHFLRENQVHHEDCKRLNEKVLSIEKLIKEVEIAVIENQSCSLQFLYESHRANAVRNGSTTVYPDFVRIKHRLRKKRNTNRTIVLANNLADVKVDNRFIADGYSLFLIYDKPGINRILVFVLLLDS